jgi:hypothetical protein
MGQVDHNSMNARSPQVLGGSAGTAGNRRRVEPETQIHRPRNPALPSRSCRPDYRIDAENIRPPRPRVRGGMKRHGGGLVDWRRTWADRGGLKNANRNRYGDPFSEIATKPAFLRGSGTPLLGTAQLAECQVQRPAAHSAPDTASSSLVRVPLTAREGVRWVDRCRPERDR